MSTQRSCPPPNAQLLKLQHRRTELDNAIRLLEEIMLIRLRRSPEVAAIISKCDGSRKPEGHEAGARPVRRQFAPLSSRVAGLLFQFALGRLQWLLAWVEASRRQFPKILGGGQAVLAHQQHALLVVDGH